MGVYLVCDWPSLSLRPGRQNTQLSLEVKLLVDSILTLGLRFGTIALLLQLVPVLSMFFLLTSAAGSALWAADLEEARQKQLLAAESVVGGAEVNDEFPPEYTDTEDQV